MILKFLLVFVYGSTAAVAGNFCAEGGSKPHQTRCDMYYKCALLPSSSVIWMPTQCDRGLIYEHSVRMCVLPAEDWECTLGDAGTRAKHDDNNVYGVNNLQYLKDEIESYRPQFYDSSLNLKDDEDEEQSRSSASANSDEIEVVSSDVVYDDNSIEIVDGHEPISDNSEQSSDSIAGSVVVPIVDDDVEFSGDGPAMHVEDKTDFLAIPIDSNPKGSVSSQLQRLSQLIQSLSDSQHNKSQVYELGPNDLNSFLANHNIQTEYQQQVASNLPNKHDVSNDGKISDEHLAQILDLQHKLQTFDEYQALGQQYSAATTTTTPTPPLRFAEPNYADPSRILLKSPAILKTVRLTDPGYSSSQIVVNRPEGSVLFSLPSPSTLAPTQPTSHNEQPYISQDTLKAVLELSKQMIASNLNNQNYNRNPNNNQNYNNNQDYNNQNNPSQQNFLQPIVRPVYYNIPIHELPIPIISRYENDDYHKKETHSNDEDQSRPHLEKISSVSGFVDTEAQTPHYSVPDSNQGDEHSTIIHNHIPITIESPSPSNTQVNRYNQPTNRPTVSHPTPTKSETRYDSFGGKVVTNTYSDAEYVQPSGYQPYPPFTENRDAPSIRYDQELQAPTSVGSPPFNNYQNNYHQEPTNPNAYFPTQSYGGYSAYQRYGQQPEQQQQPNSNLYTTSPHLTDHNVNNYINVDTPAYPTLRPVSYVTHGDPVSIYPNQIKSPHGHRNEGILSAPISTNQPSLSASKYVEQVEATASEPLYDDDDDSIASSSNDDDSLSYDTNSGGGDEQNDVVASIDLNSEASVISLLTNLKKQRKEQQRLQQQQRIQKQQQLQQSQQQPDTKHSPERRQSFDYLSALLGDDDDDPKLDESDDTSNDNANNNAAIVGNRASIVHYGDTYMTYDAYRKSVEPLLRPGTKSKVEILTCVTGARQPSTTDCSKYFVCNAATGKVLTYVCPEYTAFNLQTRFCDVTTYSTCNAVVAVQNTITIDGNKKLKKDAEKALTEAKRVRAEAVQAQQLTALLQLETENILKATNYIKRPSVVAQPVQHIRFAVTTTTTQRPRRKPNKPRKRRIQCSEPSKVADKLSRYNYFTCFKGANGKLKAMKQTCPGGLEFCPKMRVCTARERCGR